jgi:hypothetical protein
MQNSGSVNFSNLFVFQTTAFFQMITFFESEPIVKVFWYYLKYILTNEPKFSVKKEAELSILGPVKQKGPNWVWKTDQYLF